MKLAEFTDSLWKQISKEEQELEFPVMKATIQLQLAGNNKGIVLHEWEYEAKESQY